MNVRERQREQRGPMMPVMPTTLVSAPCSWPCSDGADAPRHQALRRRPVESPERHDRNAGDEPASRSAPGRRSTNADGAERRPAMSARRSPKPRHDRSDEPALHDREATRRRRPAPSRPAAVPSRSDSPRTARTRSAATDARGSTESARPRIRAAADASAAASASRRIGARPRERRAALGRQRLGQHEQAVHRVGQAEAGRDPERQPRTDRR